MKTLTPRARLLAAAAMLALLPLVAAAQGLSFSAIARLALALAAVAGLAWWFLRARGRGARFQLPPRMSVVTRVGLSQRSGLALVDVDGESFLVVHGDGFARIRKTARRAAAPRLVTDEVAAARRAGRRNPRRTVTGGTP